MSDRHESFRCDEEDNDDDDDDDDELEEEEDEVPQIPLNLNAPQNINLESCQDVKVGNNYNVTLNVNKMVVRKDETNQILHGMPLSLAGLLANLSNISCSSSQSALQIKYNDQNIKDTHKLPLPSEEAFCTLDKSVVTPPTQNVSCSTKNSSGNIHSECAVNHTVVSENSHCESRICTVNDQRQNNQAEIPLQEDFLNELYLNVDDDFSKNHEGNDVSLDSIINEFIDNINTVMIAGNDDEALDTPPLSAELKGGIFSAIRKCKIKSKVGKLTGYLPLIRKKGIQIDLTEGLIFVSIPLKLDNLNISFDEFCLDWNDNLLSVFHKDSGVMEVKIPKNRIMLNLSMSLDEKGFSEEDFSIEVNFKKFCVEFEGNFIANQLIRNFAKERIEVYISDKYSHHILLILTQLFLDNIKSVLHFNDIHAKIATFYM